MFLNFLYLSSTICSDVILFVFLISSDISFFSGIILSITFNSYKSFAVNFIFSAASLYLLGSFHKILLYPSGDNIE